MDEKVLVKYILRALRAGDARAVWYRVDMLMKFNRARVAR